MPIPGWQQRPVAPWSRPPPPRTEPKALSSALPREQVLFPFAQPIGPLATTPLSAPAPVAKQEIVATSSAASDAGTDGSFVQIRSDASDAGTDGSFVKLGEEAKQKPPPAEDKDDDGAGSFASLPDFNEAEADFGDGTQADDDAASVAETAKGFEVSQSSSAAASPEQAAPIDSEVRATLERDAAAPEQPEEQPAKTEPAAGSGAAKIEFPADCILCTYCDIWVRSGSQWTDHTKCNLHLNKERQASKPPEATFMPKVARVPPVRTVRLKALPYRRLLSCLKWPGCPRYGRSGSRPCRTGGYFHA